MSFEPDIIIVNARVLTMDDGTPHAEAISIKSGEIALVGDRKAIDATAGVHTRIVDAQGATVLPGFIESHIHLFMGAAELGHLQLFGSKGFDALKTKLSMYASERPDDLILFCQGCDYTILGEGGDARRATTSIVSYRTGRWRL